jgi:hypothetical protein
VPESPQSLYTICRLYIKEDILCSNQDPIPSRKCQNTSSKVVTVAPATCCSLLTFLELGSINGSPCLLPSLPHAISPPLLGLSLVRYCGAIPLFSSPMAAARIPSHGHGPLKPAANWCAHIQEVQGRRRPLSLWQVGPRRDVSTQSCRFLCCVQKFISRVLELLKS